MNTLTLTGQPRTGTGTTEAKKVRAQQLVPAVLSRKAGAVHFAVEQLAADKLTASPHTHLITLEVAGSSYTCILKQLQIHPIHDYLMHLDFVEVDAKEPIEVELPLKLKGTAEGVTVGGKLVQKQRKVKVRGLYTNLPATVEVDVTALRLGKSLKVREVQFADYQLTMAGDVPLATVEIPRALRQEQGPKGPEAAAPAKK